MPKSPLSSMKMLSSLKTAPGYRKGGDFSPPWVGPGLAASPTKGSIHQRPSAQGAGVDKVHKPTRPPSCPWTRPTRRTGWADADHAAHTASDCVGNHRAFECRVVGGVHVLPRPAGLRCRHRTRFQRFAARVPPYQHVKQLTKFAHRRVATAHQRILLRDLRAACRRRAQGDGVSRSGERVPDRRRALHMGLRRHRQRSRCGRGTFRHLLDRKSIEKVTALSGS